MNTETAPEADMTEGAASGLNAGLGGWQAIETAPNGQDLLLAGTLDHRDVDWRIKVGHRCAERYNGWTIYGASWEPKYWMPLPTPPND